MKTHFKNLILLCAVILLAGCNLFDEPEHRDYKSSTALSIFVKDGKVGITSLVSTDYRVFTEFWIDSAKTDIEKLTKLLPAGNYFRTSIDEYYRATTVYKKNTGEVVVYRFPRNYSLHYNNQLHFYKSTETSEKDTLIQIDTLAIGAIHAVDATHDEVFTGFFGRESYAEFGAYMQPTSAFYWDGTTNITQLPMPKNYFFFKGVSCIHKSGNDVYVGGKMDFPMYWKNKEMVRLHENYGEVNQLKTVGEDVFAVGFYNKNNSNSTNHTACYWKNDELVELEDGAIAYSIFISGKDVYVAGAKGRFPAEYKACYWKNGKRVMLRE